MKLHKKSMAAAGICAVIAVFFAALFGLGELICAGLIGNIDTLSAGDRWSAAGDPYAVITLHTDLDAAFSRNQVENYVRSIDNALLEASISSEEDTSSVWTYSYFTDTMTTGKGRKANVTLQTMAVGGNFFTFHPLQFVHGAPFLNDPSLPYGVVLDEDAAWRLFGALNVVGMTFSIGEKELTVTGIVRAERDSEGYLRAYGDIPRIYMSYYGYENIFGETSNITTLEVTMPNPVSSFAMNIFETVVTIQEDTMTVIENSDRYSLTNRFNRVKELPYLGMRNDRIIYPYFENELRVLDYTTAVWMIFQLIAGGIAVLTFLCSLICLFGGGFSVMGVVKAGLRKLEKHRSDRKRKQNRNQKRIRPGISVVSGKN